MTIISEDQILSEFDAWAAKRGQLVDTTLLGAMLAAHTQQQRRPPTVWIAGDVKLAAAQTLAAHPDVLVPGVEALEATLDSFFRFLRNTGRLAGKSADVATLRKEVRREARNVAEMLSALEGLAAVMGVEEDLDYDLIHPDDPRHETIRVLRDIGITTADVKLRWWGPLPAIERAAEQGMATDYLQRLQRLPELVAPELHVDSGLVPGPADAWRIASELELRDEILADADPRLSWEALTPEMVQRSNPFCNWWLTAYVNGLVKIGDGIASPGAQPARVRGQSATLQLMFASRVAGGRLADLCETGCEHWPSIIHLVVGSLLDGRAWCSLPESVSFAVRRERGRSADEVEVERAARTLERAVDALVEAGVLERNAGRARLTDFGAWVVDDWVEKQFEGLMEAM